MRHESARFGVVGELPCQVRIGRSESDEIGSVMCVAHRDEIAQGVLSYLLAHAAARDTFEGIVEWWLLEQTIKRDTVEVKAVLDDLAARKLLLTSKTADRRIHYRVNPRKEKELRALLQS